MLSSCTFLIADLAVLTIAPRYWKPTIMRNFNLSCQTNRIQLRIFSEDQNQPTVHMTTVCWKHHWVKCDTSGNYICRGTAWQAEGVSSVWTSASPVYTPVVRCAEAWLSGKTYIILIFYFFQEFWAWTVNL